MILPPVHQLLHTVQKDNISGSNLLQLLHSKVLPLILTDPLLRCSASQCCMCMHAAQSSMSSEIVAVYICRLSVEYQSCSPALHDCCGTATKCFSSSCQRGMLLATCKTKSNEKGMSNLKIILSPGRVIHLFICACNFTGNPPDLLTLMVLPFQYLRARSCNATSPC